MTGCILASAAFLETSVFIRYAYICVRLSFPVCSRDFQSRHIFWIKKFFMPGQYLVLMGRLIYLWISSLSAQQVFTEHPHAGRLGDRHPPYGGAYRTEHRCSKNKANCAPYYREGRRMKWDEVRSQRRLVPAFGVEDGGALDLGIKGRREFRHKIILHGRNLEISSKEIIFLREMSCRQLMSSTEMNFHPFWWLSKLC